MDLINLLDSESSAAKTQSLDLSFNELYDMYRSPDHELNISPEYQRNRACAERTIVFRPSNGPAD